ncbi:MAG: tetratricopeptide repeat protein [Silvibacterium sp.]
MPEPLQTDYPAEFVVANPPALLAQGLRLHASGKLAAAAHCYQQSLDISSQNPDALLLLGILARQTRHFSEAIALTQAAIAQRPAAHYFLNLAYAQRAAGNLAGAEESCRSAISLAPNDAAAHCWLAEILLDREEYADAQRSCEHALAAQPGFARAHHGIGNILCRQGDFAAAAACYRQAIMLAPRQAEFHFGLGYALNRLGDTRKARAAFTTALKLRPSFTEAHLNLGNLYYDRGIFPAAAAHYQSALRIRPCYAKACINLGNALAEKKDWAAARACFQKALALVPASAELHNSIGNLHYSQKNMLDAAQHYRHALELDSSYARAHINLGNALLALGQHSQARSFYERGLTLDAALPGALYNLALAQLRDGEFLEGWRNYESRWSFEELHLRRRNFRAPLWRGEPLHGKTILLHAEQGLGDTIQFARYVPLIAARGARVILEVQPPLVRLLQQLPGVESVIPYGAGLPAFDCHCPLMSLPLAFGTTTETIPSPEGYLNAEHTANSSHSKQRINIAQRIGIVWSGNPRHKGNANRSMPLEALLPLTDVPGLTLISLQKGTGIEQLAPLQGRVPIEDAASSHADMHETAALVRTLDLVLTVDTSIAHLAGAMAKPVWIMLPWVADWRWMERRANSPWYTSARLFRQTSAGDWGSVVSQIIAALRNQNR